MDTYSFDENTQNTFNDINEKLETAYQEEAHLSTDRGVADQFWKYLVSCENYFLSGAYKEDYRHDMENMFGLYFLNNLVDQGFLTEILRSVFGMPKAQIDSSMVEEWNVSGWVAGDGTIYAISKYCQLDIKWTLVLVYYYYYKLRPSKRHDFVLQPDGVNSTPSDKIPSSAKIAIIGDWGTGKWTDGDKTRCPAQLVIAGVVAQNPDYIVHLGDVYYAGTENEERENFLQMIPEKYKGKFYTMNSNHEMYDGANGLMGTTLQNPRFSEQNKSTYFSFEVGNWIIVGLDSAYYDESALYMDGIIATKHGGQKQLEFLTKAYNSGKQVLLCTHHNGIEVDKHGPKPNNPLWGQVLGATHPHVPDVWYWGHVHNGIVYNEDLAMYGGKTAKNGNKPKMRCCGHASIPYGDGSYLEKISTGNDPEVLYYGKTPMPDPSTEVQKMRVLNGFSIVEINNSDITETFYEVSNEAPLVREVWHSPKKHLSS